MTHSKQVSARGLLILIVFALCVAADRLSKAWALSNLTHGQPQQFIPGFIKFTLTTNPGAAFSIGSENGQIMGVVATVLSIVILAWIVKRAVSTAPLPVVEQIGMGCLLGGAIGNLIDRYTRGQVTDFLEFTFVTFPVFNVADALIDVGIGCLFISMYLYKNDEQPEGKNATDSIESPSQCDSSPSVQAVEELKGSSNCTRRDPNAIISSDAEEDTVNGSNIVNGSKDTSEDTAGTNTNSGTSGAVNQTTKRSD